VQRVHEPQFRAHAQDRRVPRRVRGCAPIPVSSFSRRVLCALSLELAPKRKRFQGGYGTISVTVNAKDGLLEPASRKLPISAVAQVVSVNRRVRNFGYLPRRRVGVSCCGTWREPLSVVK
jgi:hypothetical protein